jgi:hypothetical protein
MKAQLSKFWRPPLALAAVGLILVLGNAAADPDFGNIDDLLAGQRYLLRTDDLIVTAPGQSGVPLQNVILDSSASQISTEKNLALAGTTASGFTSGLGRVFDLPNDVIVTVSPNAAAAGQQLVTVTDVLGNQSHTQAITAGTAGAVAIGDLNQDGFADLVVGFESGLQVATATAVTDLSQGLSFGGAASGCDTGGSQPGFLDIAIADLNGDGQNEIAALCLASASGEFKLLILTVDPSTLAVTGTTTSWIGGGFFTTAAMVAGNFAEETGAPGAFPTMELVMVAQYFTGDLQTGAAVLSLSVNDAFQATVANTLDLNYLGNTSIYAASGQIDWFGATEQVAVGINNFNDYTSYAYILTLDSNLNLTEASRTQITSCIEGIALGNFDRTNAQGQRVPDLQLATIASPTCLNPTQAPVAFIYNVDYTNGYALTQQTSYPLGSTPPIQDLGLHFAVGDTQGRSVLLGPPEKVTVSKHLQPDVILGMPPMHVDYVTNNVGQPDPVTPSVFNVSAFPTIYYSRYEMVDTASNQSSSESTTSYSFSTKKTTANGVSFGIPDENSIGADVKVSTEQAYSSNIANKYNTYVADTFDVSTQTGFSDLIWYTEDRFTIYVYPVLGRQATGIGSSELEPLYVQFSGPDQVVRYRIDGSLLEWYQPAQESGNVFSYPWSQRLLESLYPGFDSLIELPATVWATDSSGDDVTVNWSGTSGTEVTAGSSRTHSFDTEISATAGINIGIFNASTKETLEYNKSSSFGTLNTTIEQLGESTGVKVLKPAFDNPQEYAYSGQTYIFGRDNPAGTVQSIPLTTDVKATGPLWVGFAADPRSQQIAGSWWTSAYTLPDVAVNHSARWDWTPPADPNQPDVVTFNQADAADPAGSEFYFMKGLLITPADTTDGPQTTTATAGQGLTLRARVYNYSLADMAPGATVKVRFYAQAWNNADSDFSGESILIEEQSLPSIPSFNASGGEGDPLNWVWASTVFDTTGYDDKYLIFWVVVWVEQNGTLAKEMPGHGLTSVPGTLTAITDVPIETYSNNVGFYKQPIYILPASMATIDAGAVGTPDFWVESVSAPDGNIVENEKVAIKVVLRAGASDVRGITVTFFDGDPAQGGRAFEQEMIPFLSADQVYTVRASWKPAGCGIRTVFVEGYGEGVTALGELGIDVACRTVICGTLGSDVALRTDADLFGDPGLSSDFLGSNAGLWSDADLFGDFGLSADLLGSAAPLRGDANLFGDFGFIAHFLGSDAALRTDADWFRFRGDRGETVKIRVKPAGAYTGDKAVLALLGRGLARRELHTLPGDIQAVLPKDGIYGFQIRQPPRRGGRFEGGYCLSLESSAGAWETFRAVRSFPFRPYW